MAAAHGSWREADIARALRTTYRSGLGKMSNSGHHKVFVAEELDEDTIAEDDDDAECEALLADHGVQADGDPPVDESDLIDALITWKEQRKLHGKVKLGRGFAKPNLEAYRPRVRCRNRKKVGHLQKDCREPRRSTAPNSAGSIEPAKHKSQFFVEAECLYNVPVPKPCMPFEDQSFDAILNATIKKKLFH